MEIRNLDVGVKGALCAHLKARGMSVQQAETKATAALAAATAFVRAEAAKDQSPLLPGHMATQQAWRKAFGALKAWSIANVP
jgi:hypothetical protein